MLRLQRSISLQKLVFAFPLCNLLWSPWLILANQKKYHNVVLYSFIIP